MEDDSNNKPPPVPSARSGKERPMSAKRQKILAEAFAQLRKARSKVDPSVLSKIRQIVKNSPDLMKKLGFSNETKVNEDMPLSTKGRADPPVTPSKLKAPKAESDGLYEKIDQEKNMEIMAKLMQLNPESKEGIKAVIQKAGK